MKYIYTILLVLLFAFSVIKSQVPNGGFENWTDGEPDFWTTNNADTLITITTSNSSHSGSSALKGECIPYFPPFLPVMGPIGICDGDTDDGFPIEFRYNSLKGFYKLNSQGGDQLFITLWVSVDTQAIGVGSILLNNAASYTEFAIPITYIDPATPNKCIISFQIINPVGGINVTLGSEMYLDDLELSMDMVSDVEAELQPFAFQLEQNYPNPFNPSTKISWQSAVSGHQTLKIYDVLGNEVATLIDEYRVAGNYEIDFDATGLSSGVYFYKLIVADYSSTKKMILMK
ncbi:MAG: T9SS type A sorting domain-containing protein [Ignavibacteriaceae bacterium]